MKVTFRDWNLDALDAAFDLRQVRRLPILDEWLSFSYEVNAHERQYLTDLQENFMYGGDDWNEYELENKFISPLLVFSKIDNQRFAYFLERPLTAKIGEYELSGNVDGMIATGFRNPKQPYFCMAEYKRGTDPDGDPKGQALVAMFVAQHINADAKPVFGSFIIGKLWHFMALQGKEYAISKGFTCDDEDIFHIFRIVKGLRYQIEKQLDTPPQ
jgi:hypothetical protein